MASIELRNIVKRFDKTQTIHNVDLSIDEGEFVVFVGPSGCGKSTLLRLIAGLEEISSGEILIGDKVINDVAPAQRGVAMVFQSYALYPHMTVEENMGYALKVNGCNKEEIKERVRKTAIALQLLDLLDRKPAKLSGGQRQRVAIGRAIIRDPKVFLFDEPLSNLDAELRVEMRLHIAKLHQELKSTMVYVTHDQVEAMTLADKIVVLRDGVVEQVGSPMELYFRPINLFVAGFIGSPKVNFIEGSVAHWQPGIIKVELAHNKQLLSLTTNISEMSPGDKITLGIRPEHISFEKQLIELDFETEVIERLGNSTYIFGQCCGLESFKVLSAGDVEIKPYQSLTVYADPDYFFFFDKDGNNLSSLSAKEEVLAKKGRTIDSVCKTA